MSEIKEIEPLPDGIDFKLMCQKINEIVAALKDYGLMGRIGGTPESLGGYGLPGEADWPVATEAKDGPEDVEKT